MRLFSVFGVAAVLFLNGCYNSPPASVTQSKTTPSTENKSMERDFVKEAQENGDLQNLECIIQKDGKQFAKYLDIRNDSWVASKLYDTSLFQYGGKPKTGEIELAGGVSSFEHTGSSSDREKFCLDAVWDSSGSSDCIMFLDVKSMAFVAYDASKNSNGDGFTIDYSNRIMDGVCRKQEDIFIR